MLDRIKRRQFDGFKEFVVSMETTGLQKRQQIFTAGVLEDPNFMSWVMKNLRSFEDFLALPSDEMQAVLLSHQQTVSLFSKAIFGLPPEKLKEVESSLPKLSSQIRDELSYLKDLTPVEKDSARYFIVKTTRTLQKEEKIQGFEWKLPPMDVFYPKTYPDGIAEIFFDSGAMAAEGAMEKNKRTGVWVHYYDTGKILAQGSYQDGLKDGEWEFFYLNGSPKSKGSYYGDLRDGQWTEWDRNGNVSQVIYREGVKEDQSSSK